jgi:integrase
MPRLSTRLPKYCLHKATGKASVTLSGKTFYLGPYGSRVSHLEYDRLTSEWLAAGRTLPADDDLTIAEMLVRYLKYANSHYRKNDRVTHEVTNIKCAIRLLNQLYSHSLVKEFGPLKLKTIQGMLVAGYTDTKGKWVKGIARRTVNHRISALKRLFAWAVSEEMAPPSLSHALATVAGLRMGRTAAYETDPVMPVADDVIEATLPFLQPVIADMVRFQRLVGCRPAEVCIVRPGNVDRSEEIWVYRPEEHKNQHRGKVREIRIGPKGQAILTKYLERGDEAFCFSPTESEKARKVVLRQNRKTKVQPSQRNRKKKKPKRRPGGRYYKDSYNRAIRRACEKAFPAPSELKGDELKAWNRDHRWSPNQLRHSAATAIRRRFGLEAAQVVLGHSRADVTQIYAERDGSRAAEVMRDIG